MGRGLGTMTTFRTIGICLCFAFCCVAGYHDCQSDDYLVSLFFPDTENSSCKPDGAGCHAVSPYYISGIFVRRIRRVIGGNEWEKFYSMDSMLNYGIVPVYSELPLNKDDYEHELSRDLRDFERAGGYDMAGRTSPSLIVMVDVRRFRSFKEKQWHAKKMALLTWRFKQAGLWARSSRFYVENTRAYNESSFVISGLHRPKGRSVIYVKKSLMEGCYRFRSYEGEEHEDEFGVHYCMLDATWLE